MKTNKLFTALLLIVTVFLSQKIISQTTVTINNMQYIDGTPISNGGTIDIISRNTARVQFVIEVNNPNGLQGSLKVFTKRSSSSSSSPSQQGGTETIFNFNTFYTSSKDITLSASNFNSSGGSLYAEFETSSSIKYTSNNFPITVTAQPDPAITNNTISGNQTITEGQTASTLTGSTPNGGNGSYSYQWQRRTTGSWNNISGANSRNYAPGSLTTTTEYRRIVSSGNAASNTSNSVTVTVTPLPAIGNNSFSFDGNNTLVGSTPTGGNGTYTYEWRATCECTVGGNYYFQPIAGATGKNYVIPQSVLNGPNRNLIYYSRIVRSSNKTDTFGEQTILGPLRNNTISFNGSTMVGSTPQGGTGVYIYEWEISNFVVNNEVLPGENDKDLFVYPIQIDNPNGNGYFRRTVKSGFEVSKTSYVEACITTCPNNRSIDSKNVLESTHKVYPNPLSDSELYFETNYKNDTIIEIFIKSIQSGKEISIYEGLVKAGKQVLTFDQTSELNKGLYIYTIKTSTNIESGKIVIE